MFARSDVGRHDKGKIEKAGIAVARSRSEKDACHIPPVDTDGFVQLKGIPNDHRPGSRTATVRQTLGGIKEDRRIEDVRRTCDRFTSVGTWSTDHELTW